jgi:peptidoglycan/LPS O-acetylase OafA/YrhL
MASDALNHDQAVRVAPQAPGPGARAAAPAQAGTMAGEILPTEYVDGVRGIAATYVVLNHARFLLFVSAATALATHPGTLFKAVLAVLALTRYGVAGVMCFFIVSGYAIHYRQAFKLAGKWQKMSWKDYAWHRARRLYPPLGAALVITFVADAIGSHFYPGMYTGTSTVLSLGGDHTPTIASFFGTLTFMQGFVTKVFGSNDPLWSLAYEGFFYLMYPLVLGLDQRLGPVKTLGLFLVFGLSIAALIGIGITPDGLHVDLFSPLGIASHALNLLAMWPAWVAGAFIADARAGRVHIPTRWWSIAAVAGIFGLGASALYLVVKNPNIQINDINIFYLIWVASFFGPIGWLCAGRHEQRTRNIVAIAFRPLKRLGAMSYSLYVIHFPVLAMICALWLSHYGSQPRSPWLLLGGIVAALSVAYGVYHIAEKPVTKRNLNRVEAQVKVESGILPAVALAGAGGGAVPMMAPSAATPHVAPASAPRMTPPAASLAASGTTVASAAQAWAQQRWQAQSRVEIVQELPPGEMQSLAAALGAMPERAWLVRLHLAGGGVTNLPPAPPTVIVAQHLGAYRVVDLSAR